MAGYTKTAIKGFVANTLNYRGHLFQETWRKDGLLEGDGSIETSAKEIFEEMTDEEYDLIKDLGSMNDYDLEEAITRLTELEEQYAYKVQ